MNTGEVFCYMFVQLREEALGQSQDTLAGLRLLAGVRMPQWSSQRRKWIYVCERLPCCCFLSPPNHQLLQIWEQREGMCEAEMLSCYLLVTGSLDFIFLTHTQKSITYTNSHTETLQCSSMPFRSIRCDWFHGFLQDCTCQCCLGKISDNHLSAAIVRFWWAHGAMLSLTFPVWLWHALKWNHFQKPK